MRRAAAITLVLVLGLGAAGAWLGGTILAGMVETRSAASLRAAVDAAGHGWAGVATDGLAVTLTGTAPDPAARAAVLALAARLVEPGRITDAMAVARPAPATDPQAPELSLAILRDETAVTLTGRVPVSDDAARMAAALAPLGEGLDLTDALERVAVDPPPHWDGLRDGAIAAALALRRAQVEALDCRLRLTGVAPDGATRDRLMARLQAGPCPIEAEILVPRPLVSPYVFSLSLDGGQGRLFACTAPGPAEIARIRAALDGVALAGGFSCREGLGAPSARWADAVATAVAALRGLGGGALTLSDSEIRFEGLPAATAEAVLAAVAALGDALPPGFSVETTARAPSADPADAPGPAALFQATRDGGTLVIAGPLRNEAAATAVASYAAAHFGSAAVEDRLATDPALPDGWTARVIAGLDALALLEDGQVTVTETRIALAGWTEDPTAKAAARSILGRVSGVGTALAIEIAFRERPAPPPPPPPPDPALCIARIGLILDEGQIQFPSASVAIEPDSLPLIDRIAAEMTACTGAVFEIGGHTDNSGPADKNLSLSRGRAEAVVDALLARGVDLDRMVAKGYGESLPIADNATEEGRALNRRIGVTLVESADDDGE